MKRFVKNYLFVFMLFGCLAASLLENPAEAKTKVKLNKTAVVLTVNNRYQLKVKGTKKKAVWKSSNKKVATVTSKGTVKGMKEGKAIVTVKTGGKKYACKVTVKMSEKNLIGTYKIKKVKEGTKTYTNIKAFGVENDVLQLKADHMYLYNGQDGKWKFAYDDLCLYGEDDEDYRYLAYENGYLVETYKGYKFPDICYYYSKIK